jgi:proteasome lid subunit RPN8/RPN11
LRCQFCGGETDSKRGVCSFCGASFKTEEPRKKTEYRQTEPPSELALKDIAEPIIHTTMAAKDILTGDVAGLVADGMKVLGDLSKLTSNKKEPRQKIVGKPDGSIPYYAKPKVEEPRDQQPNWQPSPQEMAEVPVYGNPKGHPHRLDREQGGPVAINKIGIDDVAGWEESQRRLEAMRDTPSLTTEPKIEEPPPANYYTIGSQGIVFTDNTTNEYMVRKPQKGARQKPLFQSINTPFFINNESLSQMVMSAFEVLPKETFGLLFGTIKPRKVFISSIQPSQEVVSREEASVQPDKEAIDRLEALRSRLSTTNLIGSYHSHVYLSREGIESIEEGASPSSQDAENLLSSQWRQILVIVGYFSSESWRIPVHDSGWRRMGNILCCNKAVEAMGHRGFQIRTSAYIKHGRKVCQIPIFLAGGTEKAEGHTFCPICGGEVIQGVCRHCGSRVE